jgi:hypothetical protein
MTLPELHKKSIRCITKEELHNKLANARLGYPVPPDAPSLVRGKPDDDCPLCVGTGWAFSKRFQTFLVCKCTGDSRPDFTPTDYTDL